MGVVGNRVKSLNVAIFGTGYVGVVTGACLAHKGHRITLVDIAPDRVKAVQDGHAPMEEAGLDALIQEARKLELLSATTRAQEIVGADIFMIAVGTPSDAKGNADLSALKNATLQIADLMASQSRYSVIAVKSTVPPGTTANLVKEWLESSGKKAGRDFGLCMNPEFLSQGNAVFDASNPDRIVIGALDSKSAKAMDQLYAPFNAPILHLTLTEAECVKYAANMIQATLISASNQLASLSEKTPDVDHYRVMQAVHMDRIWEGPENSRAGATRFLMGGIGFGGSCFPKDVEALIGFAQERNVPAPFLKAILEINEARPTQVLELLAGPLQGLKNRRIAVLGLAFKPGTDDLRHSPGLKIIKALKDQGADIIAHDCLPSVRRQCRDRFRVAATLEQALKKADAAIITTAWPEYQQADWAELAVMMNHPLVLDGRLFLDPTRLPAWLNLLRVGSPPDLYLSSRYKSRRRLA